MTSSRIKNVGLIALTVLMLLSFGCKKKVAAAATPAATPKGATAVTTKETPKATAPAAPANVAVPANAAPPNTALANKDPKPEESEG